MKNLIFVSSPLQALIVWLLLNSDSSLKRGEVVVFLEGEFSLPSIHGVKHVNIKNTRGHNYINIPYNLDVLFAQNHSICQLWISDLLWPMNNAAYSALLKTGKLHRVNFYDEGMVLYWMERMSVLRYVREILKFAILRCKTGLSFTRPSISPFYGNRNNGKVFALHPELLDCSNLAQSLRVDLDAINRFDTLIDSNITTHHLSQVDLNTPAALLLSQPYYRLTTHKKFRSLLFNCTNFLRSIGYDELYVKLHPSEDDIVFREFYDPLGYKKTFECVSSPVEAKLHALSKKTALVSFNSSALLNAKAFGYQGRVISYGLDWIADQYRFQSIMSKQKTLFYRAGIEIELDVNNAN